MTRRSFLKRNIEGLTRAIIEVLEVNGDCVTDDDDDGDGFDIPMSMMNVEKVTTGTPVSVPQHLGREDALGRMLPSLLGGEKGLANVPLKTLRQNLQPVMKALEGLDAEVLLDLEKRESGPVVREGLYCKPIYDGVLPAIRDNDPGMKSCVRYLHISEVPDKYSIGIFVFAPGSRIPLHDHPEMCVLSRVLYGDLHRLSLDLARDDDATYGGIEALNGTVKRSSWLAGWWNRTDSFHQKFPKGSKRAYKNQVDHLRAPDVAALFPYEGNLHEFVAGPHGAAVLDVLLPPYDNAQNRDCTFYEIHDDLSSSSFSKPSGKDPCVVVPTGQPETFHCISGRYQDLGESDDMES